MCSSICLGGPGSAEGGFFLGPLPTQSPNRTTAIHSLEKTGPTDHLKGQRARKSSVTPRTVGGLPGSSGNVPRKTTPEGGACAKIAGLLKSADVSLESWPYGSAVRPWSRAFAAGPEFPHLYDEEAGLGSLQGSCQPSHAEGIQ